MKSIMLTLPAFFAATLCVASGSVQAGAFIDGTATEQAVKQANAAVADLKQREQPQWLESGLRIVQSNEDCSAPGNQLAFATDINGKLMACSGPQSKWTDAAPIVRAIDQASFSCGAGIPGLC
jgi:hypothetical protein